VKIDRIVGKSKRAILDARATMKLSQELAEALHVIRVYDAGKLSNLDYTYHVLQLVDGDTLDHLLGVAGVEHRSLSSQSKKATFDDLGRPVDGPRSARNALGAPFTDALSPAMTLELLISFLLLVEEVHACRFAINDLKNGNVMLGRNGQIKGIDLDSYTRAHSPRDKMADFMFLAVSLILLLCKAPLRQRQQELRWQEMLESRKKLRNGLDNAWPTHALSEASQGRVDTEEILELFADLVARSRDRSYASEPDLFSADIARLLELKYRVYEPELVID
jgi:serine/threonine protein kinase